MPNFENNLFKGLDNNTETLEIKVSGLYHISIEGNFYISDAVNGNGNNRVIMRVLKTPFTSDYNYRNYFYHNIPSDVFSLNGSYVMKLEKGDKLSIDVFNDGAGTLSHKVNSIVKCELII